MKYKPLITRLVAILLLLAVVHTLVFFAAEAGHTCSGEHCTVCAQLTVCSELLRVTVSACILVLLAILMRHSKPTRTLLLSTTDTFATPVLLKVKLSN